MTPPQTEQEYERPAGASQPSLRVGCAMWAHKEWPGRHFPADTKPGTELGPYATWCTAVEGNTTFYATPPATTIARWRDDTPDGFQFCFKLPRTITHERRLRNVAELTLEFCDRIAPMAERLGPIQIQLPPSFSGTDLPVLAAFLEKVPSIEGFAGWAVELRHADFFVGGAKEREVDSLLTKHGANRVILDSRALFDRPPQTPDEVDAWEKKPRLPVRPVATGQQPIVRLIGNRDLDASLERWQQWVPTIVRWLGEGRSPVVFTHTPDNADALPLARRFHNAIASTCVAQGSTCAPLPEPETAEVQLDLLDTPAPDAIHSSAGTTDTERTG
mgnify:CR=1 FL=1